MTVTQAHILKKCFKYFFESPSPTIPTSTTHEAPEKKLTKTAAAQQLLGSPLGSSELIPPHQGTLNLSYKISYNAPLSSLLLSYSILFYSILSHSILFSFQLSKVFAAVCLIV